METTPVLKPKRDAHEVLKKVIAILNEAGVVCLGLKQILNDMAYRAPETRHYYAFLDGSRWLLANMPALDDAAPAWARRVSDIWQGRTEK